MLKTIVVTPDVHAPYHDRAAWRLFLKCLGILKPDVFVNIGDFVDSHAMSRHVQDPNRTALFRKELDTPKRLLRSLEAALPLGCRRVWTLGNHDMWLENRIREKMPELEGMLTIEKELRLKEHGWEVVAYGDSLRIGKLHLSHEFGYSGKNCGRETLAAVGDNVVFGHSHRASINYGGTALGATHVALNVGWLGDPKAATYAHAMQKRRDWQHGFGLIYMQPSGVVHAHFVPFIKGKAVLPTKPLLVG